MLCIFTENKNSLGCDKQGVSAMQERHRKLSSMKTHHKGKHAWTCMETKTAAAHWRPYGQRSHRVTQQGTTTLPHIDKGVNVLSLALKLHHATLKCVSHVAVETLK